MVNPIDYTMDVQTPFQAVMQGYQAGAAIRNDQQQQAALAQQKQAAQAQSDVIRKLMANPNAGAQEYGDAMLQVPGLKDQLSKVWEIKNKSQTENEISQLTQWGAAIQSGRPEIAADAMLARADSIDKATGNPTPESKALRSQADVVRQHPEFAGTFIKAILAAHPEGQKAITAIASLGAADREAALFPSKLATAEAEAGIKTAAATAAPEGEALGLEQKRQNIEDAKAKRDIDRLNVEISQANSETQRGQLVLERDKIVAAQKEKSDTKAADAQATLDNTEETLGAFGRILKHPGLKSGTGTGGDLAAFFRSSDAADFRADVETLKGKAFLTQVGQMKGQGSLSNAEGDKLTAAVANLDPSKQSTQSFKNNVNIAMKLFEKGRQKLLASGKLPEKGGGFVMSHPQFGTVKEGDITRLMKQNPGATREQVMQYLNSQKNSGATGGY